MRPRIFGLICPLVLLAVIIGPSSALAAEPSGIWTGSYSCSKQERIATLTFIDEETARFDFKPGKDAKPFAAGAYLMDIWRKGDELLLQGREWIQEPRGLPMVALRVTNEGDQLAGMVDHKNCSEITLKPFDESEAAETPLAGIPEGVEFPMYFSGTYQCRHQSKEGSYWELSKTPTGDLGLLLTTRATNQPKRPSLFNMVLSVADDRYLAMAKSGGWGVQLIYSSNNDLPLIEFVGRNGKTDSINCSIPEIETAENPKDFWDNYFNEASDTEIDIDTALSAARRYIMLPDASTLSSALSALEIEDYKRQSEDLWKALPGNYVASMPERIKSIPVNTPEEREQARAVFQSMESPGFRHKLNVTYLYHSHLVGNNVNPEPLYFSDNETACKRVGTIKNHINGMAAVENVIGLPAREWNDQTIESIISSIEACAQNDTTLEKSSGFLLRAVNTQVPNLRAVVARTNWLSESKKAYLEKPRNLATLLETNNYRLSRDELRSNKIGQEIYQREFVPEMQEARAEAINSAKKELDAFFMDENVKAMPVIRQFSSCSEKLNNPTGRSPDWLNDLYTICKLNSKELLSQQIAELKQGISQKLASIENEEDLIQFVRSEPDTALRGFARTIGSGYEFDSYQRAHDESKKLAIEDLEKSVLEEFKQNNEEINVKIDSLCGDSSLFQMISKVCIEIADAVAVKEKEKQCDSLISSLDIPKKFINDTLLYGDTSDTQEIQISDFSCQLSLNGINVSISDDGGVVGVEPKYGREIFSTELILVNENSTPKYWEFSEIKINKNDSRLAGAPNSFIIECLLECEF